MRTRTIAFITIFTIALAVGCTAGCAGGSLGRVGGSDELPKELKDKFEITDLSLLTAPPVPSVAVAATNVVVSEKKTKKKGRKAKLEVPPPGPAPATQVIPPVAGPVVYPMRRPPKEPIWIGEKMTFDITYFRMSAGNFTLESLPHKAIDGRKVYHIRGNAVSSQVFSLFYRLNDIVESFIDYDGVFSHRFHILLDESKQSRDSLELYDSEKRQTFYWNRWNHKDRGFTEVKEYQPIEPFSQDSLSALYYLRTLPLTEGAVYSVPVVSEGKSWEAVVTVLRREECRTPMGKRTCVVLQPETKYQGVLKKQGDSFLWLTDDDRRVVVKLEAKVRIGTVVAQLKEFEPGSEPTANTQPPQ